MITRTGLFGRFEAKKICHYYNTPSGCWRHDRCSFQHDRDETSEFRPVCKFYGTSKKCWYGKDCYFRHVKSETNKQEPLSKHSITDCPDVDKEQDMNNNEKDGLAKSVPFDVKLGKEESSLETHSLSEKNLHGANGSNGNDTYVVPKGSYFEITCGECGLTFKDGERGLGAYSAIEKHYFDMLGRADPQHVKIFHESGAFLIDRALCGACGHVFKHPEDLLRHLGNKYNAEQEKYVHKEYFWEIVHQFVDRDAGISLDNVDDEEEAEMLDFLMLLMTEHYVVELAECYTRSENEENSITTFIRAKNSSDGSVVIALLRKPPSCGFESGSQQCLRDISPQGVAPRSVLCPTFDQYHG
ncbi:hypothetical protein LSH36_26g08006 [Paralvinella palmiformis]|uniref:C3H1-type domain-containing protein n=1 Tax=Paralvinella palmiformis TaxID=53620 RepID=A0AAD9KA23_9ANNE|nr:hypothetical protein LSH36_26g08006 [Paralvinella palmiformis]